MDSLRFCSNQTFSDDFGFCSEPVWFFGKDCEGAVFVKSLGNWEPAKQTRPEMVNVCTQMGCGPALNGKSSVGFSPIPVRWISSDCVHAGLPLSECVKSSRKFSSGHITCLGKSMCNML